MMKSFRNLAFAGLLTLGAFSAMTFTSCNSDKCKDTVCQNNGTCTDGTCSCPTGYTGTLCDTKVRDMLVGNYTGSDVCGSGTYTINLQVTAATGEMQALVTNPGGFGSSVVITGTVTSSNASSATVTFTNQNVGSARTLSGTMTFSNVNSSSRFATMQFNYTVTPTVGSADNCTGNYSRQ